MSPTQEETRRSDTEPVFACAGVGNQDSQTSAPSVTPSLAMITYSRVDTAHRRPEHPTDVGQSPPIKMNLEHQHPGMERGSGKRVRPAERPPLELGTPYSRSDGAGQGPRRSRS